MAQQTALGVMALPGPVHSFSAKTAASVTNIADVCFTAETITHPAFSSESIAHPRFSAETIAKPTFDSESITSC